MKTQIFLIFLLISIVHYSYAQTGEITNIQVVSRSDGTGLIDIDYDLAGQGSLYNISLEVSFDDGAIYSPISNVYLTGDIVSVTPGIQKQIVWNGRESNPDIYCDNAKLKIVAISTNSSGGSVTDKDGNTYKTVKIGDQWWMAENLKVTRYPNGDAIPHVTDNTAWANLGDNNTDDAYCFYNNDESLGYGALYTYAAAKDACPTGWHLPSDAEWTELENYLIVNGYNYDGTTSGNKIGKSLASTSGWNSSDDVGAVGNNQSSNNTTSFTALPGGGRHDGYGTFCSVGYLGYWWSSTEYSSSHAYYRYLYDYYAYVSRSNYGKSNGFSVRCLRD